MLKIKNLSYGYSKCQSKHLVKDLNFSVEKGKIQLVYGKSGLGKSTLLRLISGVGCEKIFWNGKIFFENKNISHYPIQNRKIGFVMQDRLLFPHFTVFDNLLFVMPKFLSDKKNIINYHLEKTSMENLSKLYPYQLSGGQTSRIACLRTLLSFPKAILLDEPFSSLDTKTKIYFKKFVVNEIKCRNIPCILVSHDNEDNKISDYIAINLKNYN